MEEKKESFFGRNWKIILIVAGITALIALFVVFGGSTVSPDLRYFPT